MSSPSRVIVAGFALALVACSPKPSDTAGGGEGEGSGSGSGSGSGTGWGSGSGSGSDDPCFASDPLVEVGTGERSFEELTQDDSVVMVHGPQGGWHMLGSMRATYMTEIVSAHFTITHLDTGVVVADNTYRVATVYDPEQCQGFYPGMYGYLYVEELADGDLDTPPEVMPYADVEFCMEVTDQDDRVERDCRRVVAVPDPIDLE